MGIELDERVDGKGMEEFGTVLGVGLDQFEGFVGDCGVWEIAKIVMVMKDVD